MDGFSDLPKTYLLGRRQRVDTTRVLLVGGLLPHMGAMGENPEFEIDLGVPFQSFLLGTLLKFLQRGDASAIQLRFEIRVFPLLGELPYAIEPHLPLC